MGKKISNDKQKYMYARSVQFTPSSIVCGVLDNTYYRTGPAYATMITVSILDR